MTRAFAVLQNWAGSVTFRKETDDAQEQVFGRVDHSDPAEREAGRPRAWLDDRLGRAVALPGGHPRLDAFPSRDRHGSAVPAQKMPAFRWVDSVLGNLKT